MRPHRWPLILGLLAGLFAHAALMRAAETPIPPAPARWVTDTAGFLTAETVQTLDARLSAWEQTTGHQMLVYIAPTTGDVPIEDWAVRAFEKWKVGRKGLDDGLVLFIMPQDRKLRIEVGYGLESVVPDAIAARVINDLINPQIRAGHPDAGVTAGVDAATRIISGQAVEFPSGEATRTVKPLSLFQMIVIVIIGILILGVLVTHPALALFLLANIMSGGNRGGGGGSSGFSGGGGRSGGGGAGGSW